jgi:hypothetical protein
LNEAVGRQGEMLADAGLARIGFMRKVKNAREWHGIRWAESNHDLDRIYEADGVFYGAEIKNRLEYIDAAELDLKLRIAHHFKVRPLFIVRAMPKVHIHHVVDLAGFVLVLKYQMFPFGHRDLVTRIRDELGLPVDTPSEYADYTLERLSSWHAKQPKP